MALWQARLHACGARALDIDVRWLRMPPQDLIDHLGTLGHVLYLPAREAVREAVSPPLPSPGNALVARAMLAPLLQVDRLCVAGTVTGDGPREWLTLVDRHGRARARIHLLPDTDYLAWDALLDAAVPCTAPTGLGWSRFRADSACRVRLELRRVAMFRLLCAPAAASCSALSVELAQRIARSEGVRLEPA